MIGVRGIYDGKRLQLAENVNIQYPKRVIVTFLEDEDDRITSHEMHLMAQQGGAFGFLENEDELYSDDDRKAEY